MTTVKRVSVHCLIVRSRTLKQYTHIRQTTVKVGGLREKEHL